MGDFSWLFLLLLWYNEQNDRRGQFHVFGGPAHSFPLCTGYQPAACAKMLALWGRRKGLGVIGTGDFTHPGWRTELADALIEAEPGLYRLRPELAMPDDWHVPHTTEPRFVLSCKSAPSIKTRQRCARCTTCS